MNPFESIARAVKVSALLSKVPHGTTRRQIASIAKTLASWSQVDRDRWAEFCGVSAPSETTWAEVVALAGRRFAVGDWVEFKRHSPNATMVRR